MIRGQGDGGWRRRRKTKRGSNGRRWAMVMTTVRSWRRGRGDAGGLSEMQEEEKETERKGKREAEVLERQEVEN